MRLSSLEQLYVKELRDIYSAEQQLVTALPKMVEAATNADLKRAFQTHLDETHGHVNRLEQIFQELEDKPSGVTCKAMQGLVKEADEMVKEDAEPAVMDAGLIAAAQRVEHYEMAAYGCARTYARLLGHEKAAQLLQETLDEEGATDKKLTYLAESLINVEAAGA